MLTKQVENMLENLSSFVTQGVLTPTKEVELGTLVCFKEIMSNGAIGYHQIQFEQLPEQFKTAFLKRKTGEVIGSYKILAVFDSWV